MKPSQITSLDRQICGAVWTSPQVTELMELLSYEIGPRPAGSKAIGQAQELLGERLDKLGCDNVHTEPVSVIGWRAGTSRVELLGPPQRTIESIQYVHSASGNIAAELLEVGSTSNQDLDRLGQKFDGSIALIHGCQVSGSKYVPLPQTIAEIARRGALAVVTCNESSLGCPAIELAGIGDDVPIPVVGISGEDAEQLSVLARRGPVQIQIETGGQNYPCECANLVAELGPEQGADEVIVLSAHLDCFHISPGAHDNLSGVLTLMEIVSALAPLQARFKRILRLILFTGEEYGFTGSKSYVQRHADQLDNIRFVFNMDQLFEATACGVAVMWSPVMREYIERTFQHTQCEVDVQNLFCMSSDYLPFMLAGIPAGRPAHLNSACFPAGGHTPLDTAEKVPTAWVRANAMSFALMLLRMLSDPEPLPAKRNSAQEVRALIEKEDAGAALRSFGFEV